MRKSSNPRICLALAFSACALALACTSEPPPTGKSSRSNPPSIVLITIDTLRADHLSVYGYGRDTSPNIDRLASGGAVFDNCYAHGSATWSSITSLMSGFLPHETTVVKNVPVPAGLEMLAETLLEHGYRTAAVVSNYVLRDGRGYEQGFESFDSNLDELEIARNVPERIARNTTDRAIELLEATRSPLFLWVHYQDPHGPYTPPPPQTERYVDPTLPPRELRVNPNANGYRGIPSYQRLDDHRDYHHYVAQYDGEIRYADQEVGRLLEALERLGYYDDALIALTSDHGESMGEHEFYFSHGQHLYGDVIRVPLVLRYRDEFSGRRDDFVQHLDFAPTVRRLVGLEDDRRLRGGDLRRTQAAERTIVSQMSFRSSVIGGGFKLIHTPRDRRFELFDLAADPHELRNLFGVAGYEEQARDLMARLDSAMGEDRLELGERPEPPPLTEEEVRKLKSLGYVQ